MGLYGQRILLLYSELKTKKNPADFSAGFFRLWVSFVLVFGFYFPERITQGIPLFVHFTETFSQPAALAIALI
jgi:hypothetical protein